MLRVTKLTDYATVVLTALAAAPDRVHCAADLAERAGLEVPTVAKVLKPLAQAGLVEGFRGAHGGYRLAREAARISLIEIVEAMEGPLAMTQCSLHADACTPAEIRSELVSVYSLYSQGGAIVDFIEVWLERHGSTNEPVLIV